MDFQSAYDCPIALRRSGGHGIYGICAMELLDVMTRTGAVLEEKYRNITDRILSVNPALQDGIIWLNDDGTRTLTNNERADLLWPILPSLLGTGEFSVNKNEFFRHLETKGLARLAGGTHENPFYKLGTHLETRNGAFDPAESVEFFKTVLGEFYIFTGTTPKQTDYTAEQIANLNEWLELRNNSAPSHSRVELRDYEREPIAI